MAGRTETFNRRIVKVVLPTLEAKENWSEAAAADGFGGSVSAWVRHVVALHHGGRVRHLEEEARRARELEARLRDVEEENRILRDAYEKVRRDQQDLMDQYERLAAAGGGLAQRRRALDALAHNLSLGVAAVASGAGMAAPTTGKTVEGARGRLSPFVLDRQIVEEFLEEWAPHAARVGAMKERDKPRSSHRDPSRPPEGQRPTSRRPTRGRSR